MKFKKKIFLILCITGLAAVWPLQYACAQEPQVRTGTQEGRLARLAVADLQMRGSDAQTVQFTKLFNEVLWNDLDMAGVFDLVPKSFYPLKLPSQPGELVFEQWTSNEVKATDLAYGAAYLENGQFVAECRLIDLGTKESIIGLRYRVGLDDPAVRSAAHRFADEIVVKIGGGIPGIASTQIAFVSDRTGNKEIWVMDYDGYGQHAITNHRSISLTPRWSADNTKIAYTSYRRGNPAIYIQSLSDNRLLSFPAFGGLTTTPAWAPDGEHIAFTSSQSGDPEIYVSDIRGKNLKKLTSSRGVDISPTWNPKTGRELAFVSDRSGSPQIYITDVDGTNVRRIVSEGGEAVGPSWSPNGDLLAFSWRRALDGNFDIYVVDIAKGGYIQLTREGGRNEQPVWSPDGRHIAFESDRTGAKQVYVMLANGTKQKQITFTGRNTAPAWSNFKNP